MEVIDRIVDFKKYCASCKFRGTPEGKDPCNECLAYGGNVQTEKPVNYDSGKKGDPNEKRNIV